MYCFLYEPANETTGELPVFQKSLYHAGLGMSTAGNRFDIPVFSFILNERFETRAGRRESHPAGTGIEMGFSSLFFVAFFLPVFLAVYIPCRDTKKRNLVLLISSLVFYAFGGLKYLALLMVLTFMGWAAGLIIGRKRQAVFLAVPVAIFILVLGIFKYTGFFADTLNTVFRTDIPVPEILLPMGISFYTFKLISYVADVYRGRIPAERDYLKLLLYTVVFHTVMQGPIVRYGDMEPEIEQRKFSVTTLSRGLYRFSLGLAKKTILADHCGKMTEALLPISGKIQAVPISGIWLGAVCFSMQIYLDFSAYSDMAIALGEMAGFHYKENFRYPYMASSPRDFWRKWHISLSTFFRDYVYIPLGGSRKGSRRTVLNLLVVWLLTGLWHGASWNFVLWGLFWFVFIVLENHFFRDRETEASVWQKILMHVATGIIFTAGWVIFRFRKARYLGIAMAKFFMLNWTASFTAKETRTIFVNNIFFLIVAVIACTDLYKRVLSGWSRKLTRQGKDRTPVYVFQTVWAALMLILSFFAMAGNSYQPFLYQAF